MRPILAATLIVAVASTAAFAADGKALFESNRCGGCHKEEQDGVGPSRKAIAAAYAGKAEALAAFLGGAAEPIMDSSRFSMMKSPLKKTAGLSAEEREALAAYLLQNP